MPYIPFFIGAGGGLLSGMYFNLWYLLSIPVIIFVMQQMAKRDEMIFRLLGLRWLFRMRVRNLQRYSGMWVFTPNEYRKTPRENRDEQVKMSTGPMRSIRMGLVF